MARHWWLGLGTRHCASGMSSLRKRPSRKATVLLHQVLKTWDEIDRDPGLDYFNTSLRHNVKIKQEKTRTPYDLIALLIIKYGQCRTGYWASLRCRNLQICSQDWQLAPKMACFGKSYRHKSRSIWCLGILMRIEWSQISAFTIGNPLLNKEDARPASN